MKNKGITLIALIITIIVMMILVGVTVAVAINGGLFNISEEASKKTEMEGIRERAEAVRATLYANSISDKNIKFNKETYKVKLQEEFKGSEIGLTKVIVENRKYDIIILDEELNIEVRIHTEEDSYIAKTDISSGEKLYAKYIEWDSSILSDANIGTKQEIVEGYLTVMMNYGNVKNNKLLIHDNFEEWAQDQENFKTSMDGIGIDVTGVSTKEEFYQKLIESDPNITTKEQVVEELYKLIFGNITEKEVCSSTLIAYIYKDGSINGMKVHLNQMLDESKEYTFNKKGNYEIVLKTITGQELLREKIDCSNVIDNDYEFIIQSGDKNWETDGKGKITKCNLKSEKKIGIPYKIGKEKITSIGQELCSGFLATEIIIPNGIETIESAVFVGCKELVNISLPLTLKTIGNCAFGGCLKLENISLPLSLTTIGGGVFDTCESLTEIFIPENVTHIELPNEHFGTGSYSENQGMLWGVNGNIIKVSENNKVYSSDEYGVLFNKDKTELLQYPSLRTGSYTIPDSVIKIREYAFCFSQINEVISNENLEIIGLEAFGWTHNLNKFEFKGGLKEIESYAFQCARLTEINMKEGIERIGEYAFQYSDNLDGKNVIVPNSVKYIGKDAFRLGYSNPNCGLANIYFAPGNNPIPEGAPWGSGANIEKLK